MAETTRKFGWAEALASALSGLAGTDYTSLLADQIDDEERRRQLDEAQEYQRGRDYRADFNRVLEELSAELEVLGQPTSPVTAGAGPTGLAVNPNASMGYMGEAPDLLALAETLLPGHGQEVLDAARPKAGRSLRREEAEYARDRGREVAELTEDTNLKSDLDRLNTIEDWDDPEVKRLREEKAAEELKQHEAALRLARRYAAPTDSHVAYGRVLGRLEDTAYNEAWQLRNGTAPDSEHGLRGRPGDTRLLTNPQEAYGLILEGLKTNVRIMGIDVNEQDLANIASKVTNTYFPKRTLGGAAGSNSEMGRLLEMYPALAEMMPDR